ncbi:sensor histidine kinase [Pseudonocardia acaciae]|uniref:sensor histidine kinase n=1 Tax=Pseudonocardia acaciae TaxID=551276 RepID=UPI0007E8BF30|nr:HAMP domain-containing sensor histidine kinase [Pseudonocardia acaciae]
MSVRLSARARLSVLFTALVLAAGIALTALTYLLMRRNLAHRLTLVHIDPSNGGPPPEPPAPPDLAEHLRSETLAELLTQAGVALGVVTVLAAALVWLVAGRVLRPIRAISATAQRLSAENLRERVPVTTPRDELAALADTVNGMLDRIQQGVTERDRVLHSQRMFTANAAHELRTPLTTVRTAIDVTLDGQPSRSELLTMAADIRTAVEQSQRTLDGLLTLARSHVGPAEPRTVDLAAAAAGVLDRATEGAATRDVTLRTDLRPAPVDGEPVLLERMIGNLVDNAVRYNHPGGHVTLSTEAAATHASLRIRNTGAAVPPGEAAALLEPFVRGEGARTHTRTDGGAGLGLSIVQAIVTAHRGEIEVIARPTGGLDITVRFPLPVSPVREAPPGRAAHPGPDQAGADR